MRARVAIAALVLAGCAADEAQPVDRCEATTTSAALTAAERKVVGEASPYPADPMLRAREDELLASQRARRDAAWAAVARVLEPVALAVDLPAHPGPDMLPRWHTWYALDDLHRIFQKVWRQIPQAERLARAPIPDELLDAGFAWNPRAVEEMASWPEERFQGYVDSLDTQLEVDGVGGIARVGFAPAAARHLLASYAPQIDCFAGGAPEPFVDGAPLTPTVSREPLALAACEQRVFGPYFVATGETLRATAGTTRIGVRRDGIGGELTCEVIDQPCVVAGPGAFWVEVASIGEPVAGELRVEHVAPDAPWAGCLDGRFPLDAAIVKADWRRAELDFALPVHDTSAATLAANLAGDADWGDGQSTADPGPADIYTVQASSGNVYRMAGMHLMTRELDHWLWVTLWWSPEPDTDFGADRPAAIAALGAPWNQYKMCAVAGFAEGDADPGGGYQDDHPDLAAALAAVHPGVGGPSWCSNPFLELGHGNAGTNCVGCHQHGGTQLASESILGDAAAFPDHGRVQVRNNFPVDYAWSSDRGDQVAVMLRDEVLYWDDVE